MASIQSIWQRFQKQMLCLLPYHSEDCTRSLKKNKTTFILVTEIEACADFHT